MKGHHLHSRDEGSQRAGDRHGWSLIRGGGFWRRWILANATISGALALLWLIFRSGTKPSRFTYPCQQAAVSMATLAFGAPLVAAVIAARRRVTMWMHSPVGIATAAAGLLITTGLWGYFSRAEEYGGAVLEPPVAYEADIFHVDGCPQDPTGDRFIGFDNLMVTMGLGGLKFYESADASLLAGPTGIVGSDDLVVIKINYQWGDRGGTNTDLLRGLIRRIVDHPDGFSGEIVVCENAQFNSTNGFDRSNNNAQDHGLSPHDVVVWFQNEGVNISHFDWTLIRYTQVGEYSAGDVTNGYIVYDYDSDFNGRISYPKFQTDAGTMISLKYGIWDPESETYDRENMKFINVPVLKSHHAVYGATVSVKHHMGTVTRELSTNSHSAIRYGILGALLGEIGLVDLNIIDAIWINANPFSGPSTSYAGATRRDELVASTDPVALDRWAVKNILIPGFISNGYNPPWPTPSADPDDPASAFRVYLDNSMYQILEAGYPCTNDYDQMSVHNASGAAGDFDGDSDVDMMDYDAFAACFTGPGGGPVGPECSAGDFDGDGDVDCTDWYFFKFVWTDPVAVPPLPECDSAGAPGDDPYLRVTSLSAAFPNPMSTTTTISFALGAPGAVTLRIIDASGRVVRTLVNETRGVGDYDVAWDGRNDRGEPVGRGVYAYRLEAPGYSNSRKIVVR